MELTHYISHPEQLGRETLYELRSLLALYPYYQPARLLMLKNLYLLHDPSFDEELRRAAIYITDRKTIFDIVEAAHYQLKRREDTAAQTASPEGQTDRTITLIDSFLDSLPADGEDAPRKSSQRKPTAADAALDYVSYLMATETETSGQTQEQPEMKGQSLIDDFINKDGGKIELKETPQYTPPVEPLKGNSETEGDEGYFTETLARIYIKQGRYSKALEIIKRLNLNYPKKSAYFADQIRFLEKLIINNKYNNN
ncbi:MAG: tetratricopeptide repeat protein [Prevotella sp.]|nr:tetratricopeptide repeat protein [Prevotella sp.]MDD7045934.1 tetratricopeptide repeat protein [Prevotella sp.]MDY5546246.1 tetratricopeptide repeat protein [Prevotella sp.]